MNSSIALFLVTCTNFLGVRHMVFAIGAARKYSSALLLSTTISFAAVSHDDHGVVLEIETSELPVFVQSAPDQILDRGPFGFLWMGSERDAVARNEVPVYSEMPSTLGTPESALHRIGTVEVGAWIETQAGTGAALVRRHYGYVDASSLQWSDATIEIEDEQAVPLYTHLGEGIRRAYIDGQLLDVMPTSIGDREAQEEEWWIQVQLEDGLVGWVRADTEAFITKSFLHAELGQAIANEELSHASRLSVIEELLEEGADLNGRAHRHAISPIGAAVQSNDVELMQSLIDRGLQLEDNCDATHHAPYAAMQPGGDAMLVFMLNNGLSLECFNEPILMRFLRHGIALDSYPVQQAVRIAEVLTEFGAHVHEANSRGETVIDLIDSYDEDGRMIPLRDALLQLSRTRD